MISIAVFSRKNRLNGAVNLNLSNLLKPPITDTCIFIFFTTYMYLILQVGSRYIVKMK